jgi:hypothetical protein
MNNPVFDYQCFYLCAHNYLRNRWAPEIPVQVNSTEVGTKYVVNYVRISNIEQNIEGLFDI